MEKMDTNASETNNNTNTNTVPVAVNEAEMTNGITTIARAEELFTSLQKSIHAETLNPNPKPTNVLSPLSQFTRALAATSNEEIIKHFVSTLNGRSLVVEWVHVSRDDDVGFTVLNELDRVMVSGGYDGLTVDDFTQLASTHGNPENKESALALYEKWRGTNTHAVITTTGTGTGTDTDGANLEVETDKEIPSDSEEDEEENNVSVPVSPNSSSDEELDEQVAQMHEQVENTEQARSAYNDENDDMDALEIARQVAIEVEEEVGQYGDTLWGSPKEPEQEQNKITSKEDESKSNEEDPQINANGSGDLNERGSGVGVDLNENICTDTDAEEIGGPILVSASKGVPPDSPLPVSHFEAGTSTGWNGNAASTSAFRPAGTVLGSKRNFCFTGFDLNDADEGDEDRAGTGTDDVAVPPCGDSSAEASSGRVKKLKFDLNRSSSSDDEETAMPEPIKQRSICSSAPSSSLNDPSSIRGFDLNEDPEPVNDNSNLEPGFETVPFHSFLGPTSNYPSPSPYRNFVLPQSWFDQANMAYTMPPPFRGQPASPGPVPEPVPVQENGLSMGLSLMTGSSPFGPGLDLNAGGSGSMEASSSREKTGLGQFFMQSHSSPAQEAVPGNGSSFC